MPDNDCTEREGTLYVERDRAIIEVSRFLGYLDEDMVARLTIALKKLPSIDAVERKTGKWVECGDNQPYSCDTVYCCSSCGKGRWLYNFPHYCPNCGADMRGET